MLLLYFIIAFVVFLATCYASVRYMTRNMSKSQLNNPDIMLEVGMPSLFFGFVVAMFWPGVIFIGGPSALIVFCGHLFMKKLLEHVRNKR